MAEPDTGGTEVPLSPASPSDVSRSAAVDGPWPRPELLLSARTWRPASPAERRKAMAGGHLPSVSVTVLGLQSLARLHREPPQLTVIASENR